MPRHRTDRRALRCVDRIQETLRLTRQSTLQDHTRWVTAALQPIQQIARSAALLGRAVSRSRGDVAQRVMDRRFLPQLRSTVRELQALDDQLTGKQCPRIPPPRELLGELDQLDSEFGGWDFDAPSDELSVTTEPICLESIELGPFSVRLRLGQPITPLMGRLYWVEALEPNPAASNQHVTHPHVSGESVCVGDFGPDLVRSLSSGRVCDFFLMIRSILTTYNSGSPYVALDEWYGEPCSDCGRTIDQDDRHTCEQCDREVCDDCITSCQHCDTCICYGCVTMCRSCKESSCADCLTPCSDCGDKVCPGCLEEDRCPTCLENHHDKEDEKQAIRVPGTQEKKPVTAPPDQATTHP